MHTYRKNRENNFEVGYFAPDIHYLSENDAVPTGSWTALSTHATEHDAIRRVNFLNGGSTITGI